MAEIEVVLGDITRFQGDAIVNAANESLLGGGGVDGAVHRAAGPELLEACKRVAPVHPGVRCPTGQAVITPGFRLPARFVIHTVGPVWQGGHRHEDELLASCYRQCLRLAAKHQLRTIAFPPISCGVYRFPKERAARIAVTTLERSVASHPSVERITLTAFEDDTGIILRGALAD